MCTITNASAGCGLRAGVRMRMRVRIRIRMGMLIRVRAVERMDERGTLVVVDVDINVVYKAHKPMPLVRLCGRESSLEGWVRRAEFSNKYGC